LALRIAWTRILSLFGINRVGAALKNDLVMLLYDCCTSWELEKLDIVVDWLEFTNSSYP
jgi:hypothetical protein